VKEGFLQQEKDTAPVNEQESIHNSNLPIVISPSHQ